MSQIPSYISLPDLTVANNPSRTYKLYKSVPKSANLFSENTKVNGLWARTKSVPDLALMNENDQNWLLVDKSPGQDNVENDSNYINMNPSKLPIHPCRKYLRKQKKNPSPLLISESYSDKLKGQLYEKQKRKNGNTIRTRQPSPLMRRQVSNLGIAQQFSKSESNLFAAIKRWALVSSGLNALLFRARKRFSIWIEISFITWATYDCKTLTTVAPKRF